MAAAWLGAPHHAWNFIADFLVGCAFGGGWSRNFG
jgi:hypothetical protein